MTRQNRVCLCLLPLSQDFSFGVMSIGQVTTLLSLLLCAGCASVHQPADVSPEDAFVVEPKEYVMVRGAGDKTWFSAHQLIAIARRYAEEQKLGFDFEGTEKVVWVNPSPTWRIGWI